MFSREMQQINNVTFDIHQELSRILMFIKGYITLILLMCLNTSVGINLGTYFLY